MEDFEKYGTTHDAMFRAFPGTGKKSILAINESYMTNYDGSGNKGFEIASLVFDLYREFTHININAGRIKAVGETIQTSIGPFNPEEEFMAHYYAACAELPAFNVMYNFYKNVSISSLNLLFQHYDPAKMVERYQSEIRDLLNLVPPAFKQDALKLIKGKTGNNFK